MTRIYYINLDRDSDRRAFLEGQLDNAGITGIRISAVDGRALPDWAIPYFPPSQLRPGEVGCYASHLLAFRQMVDDDLEHALVLEDDSIFDAAAIDVAAETLEVLPPAWDFVHLAGRDRTRPFAYRPLCKVGKERTLVRYSRVPSSCGAYLISAGGARKLLREVTRTVPIDSDTRMPWRWGLDVYGVEPGPVLTRKFPSSINAAGGKSRTRRGLKSLVSGQRSLESARFNIEKLGIVWWTWCLLQNAMHMSLRIVLGGRRANRLLPLGSPVRLDLKSL